MANTSASSTVRGLMPCCAWIAASAATRSPERAAVAEQGRGLERELGRVLLHFAGQFLFHQAAAAGQEILGLAHQFGIAGKIDLAGTGPRAAADLIEQAGPAPALKKPGR